MSEEKEMPQQNHFQHPQPPPYYPPQPYFIHPMYQPRQMMPQMGQQQFQPSFPQQQQQPFQQQFPQQFQQQFPGDQGQLPMQQSYIENILRLNRGKLATVHMTFEGNNQRTFTGIIEAAGRDHIILSEEDTGRRVLLLMVYLDYITFNEEIEYSYPFDGQMPLSSYSPRG